MQVGQFPAAAANSLIEGYCDDFVSLASILAQTLEQVSMRQINIDGSRSRLSMIETGMRELAGAIHDLLERPDLGKGKATGSGDTEVLRAGAAAPMATTGAAPAAPQRMLATGHSEPSEGGGTVTESPSGAMPGAHGQAGRPGTRPQPGKATAASTGRRTRPPENEEQKTTGMKGNNASMPILTVFQFVERMRKSGEMRVELGDETLRFSFDRGFVHGCVSNQAPRGERISDLLVETRVVDAEALNGLARRLGRCTATQLAEAVVRERLATHGQVLEALEMQVRKRFRRACRSRDADYEFVEGKAGSSSDGRVRIAPMELSHDSRRTGS